MADSTSALRVAFVVQGEGRGHMTQALALAGFLRDAGHEITRVLVGVSPHRTVPAYFRRGIGAPVFPFHAPTQVPGAERTSVSVGATGLDAAKRLPRFVASGWSIHRGTRDVDVVVNFLDLIAGLSRVAFFSRPPALAIAHNHLFAASVLRDLPGRPIPLAFLRAYTALTALRARSVVALSYGPSSVGGRSRLRVAPPLLRPGLDRLPIRDEGHLAAYALNAGYASRLAAWQRRHADVEVRCFVEGGASVLTAEPAPGFSARELDEADFLDSLAGCRAYVGSAGFESIGEAFWLGKPALAVPTEGQLEQTLNAWDAERCGAARAGSYEDLDAFWSEPPVPSEEAVARFRAWVARAPEILVELVERTARTAERPGVVALRAGSR